MAKDFGGTVIPYTRTALQARTARRLQLAVCSKSHIAGRMFLGFRELACDIAQTKKGHVVTTAVVSRARRAVARPSDQEGSVRLVDRRR